MRPGRPERPECIDAATLAAFVDGTLDASSREAVERHLADCAECREAWAETVAVIAERGVSGTTSNLAGEMRRRSRGWIYAGAAAAIVVLAAGTAWLRPAILFQSPAQRAVGQLVSAVGTQRFTEGRLGEPFAWGPAPSATRSSRSAERSLAVDAAVVRIRELAAGHRSADILNSLGLAYLTAGKLDESIEAFEDALELAPAAQQTRVNLSAALLQRARDHKAAADATRALNEAATVLATAPAFPEALFNKALALETLGLVPEAVAAWQDYLRTDDRSPWKQEAQERLAALQKRVAKQPPPERDLPALSAAALADVAQQHATFLDRHLTQTVFMEWSRAHGASATATLQARRIAGALVDAGHASAATELAGLLLTAEGWTPPRRRCLAEALGALRQWRALFDLGDRRAASEHALELDRAMACAGVNASAAQLPLAWVDVSEGRIAAARARALAASDRARIQGHWGDVARLEFVLGAVAIEGVRLSDAEEIRRSALAAAARAGDTDVQSSLAVVLAEAADEQGDRLAAWTWVRESFATLDPANPYLRYDAFSTASIAAGHADLSGAARVFAEASLIAATELNRPGAMILSRLQLARAAAGLGEFDAVTAHLDAARALFARLATPASRASWDAELGWIEGLVFARHHPTVAIEGLSRAIDHFAGIDRPFRLAELLLHRARARRAMGSEVGAVIDLQRGAALLEDQRPSIREEQLRISRTAGVWGLFGELIDLMAGDAQLGLDVAERAKARELLDHMAPAQRQEGLRLPQLQACLPPSTAAVVYAALDDRLLMWTVTRTTVVSEQRGVTRRQLATLARAQADQLRHDQDPAASRELGGWLLPARDRLTGAGHVVFVPDGVLHNVAFPALIPAGGSEWLVQSRVPTVAPSLTAFCHASSRSVPLANVSALLVGVGDADPAAGLRALPEVSGEIEDLGRLYRAAVTLVGAAATPAAVLRALPTRPVVHFSGHAEVNSLLPARSRLFLAPGATGREVGPEAIAAAGVRSGALVVLGACDTASGPVFEGEGAINLVRPFLAGGAGAVAASLWPVRDVDARRLLFAVHKSIAGGEWLSDALASAQRDAIRSGRATSQWSGFTVSGGLPSSGRSRP